jgi:hypothetical protein
MLSILLILAAASAGLTLGLAYRLTVNLRKYKEGESPVHFDIHYTENDAEIDLLLLRWTLLGWAVTFLWGAAYALIIAIS